MKKKFNQDQIKEEKKKPGKKKQVTTSFWKNKTHLSHIGLLVAIVSIVFSGSLSNGFVNWDDYGNLLENPNMSVFDGLHIKKIFTDRVIGNYNPLPIFTFAIEHYFVGFDPFLYHLDNLLLHLVCIFFVYRIFIALRFAPSAALIGALIFGLHPMRVESVAWVTERKDVLFGAFYLWSILLYIKDKTSANPSFRNKIYIIILFFLALFSKIQAVSLPLTMLLIDYYLDKKLSWKIVIEKLPFFILSLAFGIAGIYFLSEQKSLLVSEFKVVDGILVGCLAYVIYIIKFFIPYRMSPMYPFDTILSWEYYVAPVGVLLILIIVYYAYRNKVYWLVTGIGIFTVNVIFLLQIVRAGQGMFADRFTYIPYLGLIFLVVYLIDRIVKHSLQRVKTVYASSSVFLLIFSILSWQQIGVWENGGTLWTHVLKYYPNTTTPWQNRSLYYSDNKKYDLALKDIDKALSLHSDMSVSYTCRAKIYFNLQGYQDAINDYDSAIIYEATPECYINRGIAYCALKEYDKGLEDISHGISINPDQATLKNGYRNLGKAYYETQKFEKSIENYNNFITIEPNVGEIWYNKGLSERMFNKPEDAVNSLNKAIKLVPDNGLYYRERAICWLMLGDKAKGRQDVMMAEKYGMKVEELLKEKLM